jgi:hypothetical protein
MSGSRLGPDTSIQAKKQAQKSHATVPLNTQGDLFFIHLFLATTGRGLSRRGLFGHLVFVVLAWLCIVGIGRLISYDKILYCTAPLSTLMAGRVYILKGRRTV